MRRLDGKEVSKFRKDRLSQQVEAWVDQGKPAPGLAVVLVGEDPASQVYVRNKVKACESVGMQSWVHRLPAETTEGELNKLVDLLNQDDQVNGILVQLPLPKHFNQGKVLSWIPAEKDADGLGVESIGFLAQGKPTVTSCTPSGVMAILNYYDIPLEGKEAVVIGRSQIVGLPMSLLLQQANATVTVCHSRTKNLREHTLGADIVVVAAGKPRFLGREDFKSGSVIIDVGIHRQENGKLCGDVRYEELEGHVESATPVPGGVGPMTIAMLLENTCKLAGMEISD